jgi:excisionase family DNA binding protein
MWIRCGYRATTPEFAADRLRRGLTFHDKLSILESSTEKGGFMMTREGKLLTIEQVAERLQVATITVRRLVEAGEMRVTRVGRQIRISESALQEYLDRHTQ